MTPAEIAEIVMKDEKKGMKTRRSRRISFLSAADLARSLRRAESAHGEYEKRTGQRDANWADWYAEYMVAEQARGELQR